MNRTTSPPRPFGHTLPPRRFGRRAAFLAEPANGQAPGFAADLRFVSLAWLGAASFLFTMIL